jgi:hypothetical protein
MPGEGSLCRSSTEMRVLLMAAEQGQNVLLCMPNRTKSIPLVSVTALEWRSLPAFCGPGACSLNNDAGGASTSCFAASLLCVCDMHRGSLLHRLRAGGQTRRFTSRSWAWC